MEHARSSLSANSNSATCNDLYEEEQVCIHELRKWSKVEEIALRKKARNVIAKAMLLEWLV